MRIKRGIFLTLALGLAVLLSGCWDARDINDKSLITLVITDRQNGKYNFYVEVPNLTVGQQSQDGNVDEKYDIISGSGDTYAQARREIDAQMDKPIFLGTVRALILTDTLTQYGVGEYFYRFQNMVDYRRALEVVTTRSTPEEVISVRSENNISLGYEIDDTITSLKNAGKLVTSNISDVLEYLYANQGFVLVNMDAVNSRLTYTGYTVVKDGQYAGFIPLDDARGLIWLLGSNITRNYTVQTDAYLATMEVECLSRDIQPQYINGQVVFNIHMIFDSRVLYLDRDVRFDAHQVETVKTRLQEILVSDIAQAINQSRSFDCDYLEFYDFFRIAYPNIAAQLDWASAYQNAVFNISATLSVDPGGMLDMQAQGEAAP